MLEIAAAPDLFKDLKPREILQLMLQYTVQALYADAQLQPFHLQTLEQSLFPAAMVAQGLYYVPLERHQEALSRVRGQSPIADAVCSCIELGCHLELLYESDQPSLSVDGGFTNACAQAVRCLNHALPLLAFDEEDVEGAADAIRGF